MADLLGTLSTIGEITQGADRAGYNDALRRLAIQQLQQRQLQTQQGMQQQQAMGLAAGGLAGLAQGGGRPPPPNPMPQPQSQGLAQVPSFGASGGLPQPSRLPRLQGGQYQGNLTSGVPQRMTPEQVASGAGPWAQPSAGSGLSVPQLGISERAGTAEPFKVALTQDVQTKGATMLKAGVPQPAAQQSTQAALGTIPQLDPTQFGKSSLTELWQAVDKAQPDADPVAKFLAVGMLQKMMAPQDQMAFKLYAQENQANLRVGLAEFSARNAEQRLQENILAQSGRQQTGIQAAQERQQTGIAAKNPQLPDTPIPDKWEGMPDKPPPDSGISQAIWSAALTYAQTGKMPAIGFSSGPRTQILAAQPAALKALGINPSEAATTQAEYHGLTAGENTLGRRLANLTTSIAEAEKAAPAVISTSKGVSRTEFPAANQFNQWLQVQTGDPNIIRFKGALNTFLNIYSKGINPTGQMTDQQQRHAYETLSTALSQGQIEAGIDQLTKELGYAKEGLSSATGELKGMFKPPGLKPSEPTAAPTDWSSMSNEELIRRAREQAGQQ